MRTIRPLFLLIIIAAALFIMIAYFGLRPKDFNSVNQVSWLEDKNGIRVGKYNLCYAIDPLKQTNGIMTYPLLLQ